MATLKDIRRRIVSVKNTQQITKAMKVVAASKLRRAQQAIAGARPFAEKLQEMSGRILAELSQSGKDLTKIHPLLRQSFVGTVDEKKKTALLVVSADRGLCGAYNSNLLKFAWKRFNEMKSDINTDIELYFVGRRASDFFSKRGFKGHLFDDAWTGRFSTLKSDKVAKLFTDKFLAGEVHEVEVIYTEFRSALVQTLSKKVVLPLSVDNETKDTAFNPDAVLSPYIYEPEKEKLLAALLPKQVQTQFYRILADSLASELGARMTAMDNATRNAGKMISSLTLQANRVRQASITTELMEIIGGAEALKG